MVNQQTWVEALNISPEKLSEWSSLAPPGKPLLVWCLESGHVPVSDYLQWASETFGLPVLSSSFFEQGGLDRSYFESQRRDESWSPWYFPVEQWEGLTYVACVEPPSDRPREVCLVLADPRVMAEAWEATGTGISLPPVPDDQAPPPPPEADAPQGIKPEAGQPFRLNLDETNLFSSEVISAEPPPLAMNAVREETVLTRINAEPTAVAPEVTRIDDGLTGMSVMLTPPAPDEPMTHEEVRSETVVQDFSPPTAIHRLPSAGVPLAMPSDESGALKIAFDELARTYTHSCVLRFDADQQARVYKWSDSLKPTDNGAKAVVNLGFPSFLRIVSKTGLPYHGYLVDSPTHREFFAALGAEENPGCVTAAPIRINGVLWGVVLAIGNDSLQSLENLNTVVSVTEQLIAALSPVWSKAA